MCMKFILEKRHFCYMRHWNEHSQSMSELYKASFSPCNVLLSREHNISTFIAVFGVVMYCALNILPLFCCKG